MKIVILDYNSMGVDIPLDEIRALGELTVYPTSTQEEALSRVNSADVVIINKVKITKELINAAKVLKLVCVFATGFDNIDIKTARERGIAVCNVPAYSTESVTLWTLSTALSLVTHIEDYRRYVASGAYTVSGVPNRLTPTYHELEGMNWGILGCGNIGGRVAEIAKAFRMNVIVNKRTPVDKYDCVDIDTLCKNSDILSIHCPLNDSTRSLIDKNKIALMKKSVILVNAARGAVLNENDVAQAVLDGRIGAFGCDVYNGEPFAADHPYTKIKDLPNVLLTPHMAWGAYEARKRCMGVIASNIRAYAVGKTQNRVDLL